MPQVVELPPIGQDSRGALVALVRVCKETPAKGEPFRDFRGRDPVIGAMLEFRGLSTH